MISRVFAIIALLFAACTDRGDRSVGLEVRDSAGIRIVAGTASPTDTVALSQPEWVVGSVGLEGEDAHVFELISDLVVAESGRLFIVDNRGGRVAIFEREQWVRDLARNGDGPGEYVSPIRANLIADTLFLWDSGLRRMNRYTVDGTFLGSVEIADRAGGRPIVAVRDGFVAETEWGQYTDPTPSRGALLRRDRNGVVQDTLLGPYAVPEIGWVIVDEERQIGQMVNPPVFSIRPPWFVSDDVLVVHLPGSSEIEERDLRTGVLRSLLRLDRTVRPARMQDRETYVDALAAELGLDAEARAAALEGSTFADALAAVSALLIDDNGRRWVATFDPAQPLRRYVGPDWDVFSGDGRVRVRVRFPASFELMQVRNGRAYGVHTTANGVHVVHAYRLGLFDR